jgi:hypothetical protein
MQAMRKDDGHAWRASVYNAALAAQEIISTLVEASERVFAKDLSHRDGTSVSVWRSRTYDASWQSSAWQALIHPGLPSRT